jgi:hypothetical protein
VNSELLQCLKAAVETIEQRGHYVTPNTESERPSFRTLDGCVGDALGYWKEVIARAEAVGQ